MPHAFFSQAVILCKTLGFDLLSMQTRHTRMLTESNEKESSWRQRLDAASAAREAHSTEQQETIAQLTRQNEMLASSYKQQISLLQVTVQLKQGRTF